MLGLQPPLICVYICSFGCRPGYISIIMMVHRGRRWMPQKQPQRKLRVHAVYWMEIVSVGAVSVGRFSDIICIKLNGVNVMQNFPCRGRTSDGCRVRWLTGCLSCCGHSGSRLQGASIGRVINVCKYLCMQGCVKRASVCVGVSPSLGEH